MRLTVLAFGRLKTPGMREAAAHYLKGLSAWTEAVQVELRPSMVASKEPEARRQVLEKEGAALQEELARRRGGRCVVAVLDETGRALTSRQWAEMLRKWEDDGVREAVFCVGSSLGVAETIRDRADAVLSLGPQTLPHELARVVLLEQLFRALSILNNHPYHNEG